ncbi:PepSY domain-containing protein [Arcticibacter eurypsychrophilus]|uniref:PepSY domain-containing protein n=1 Tax=Arcticibacter eurypsychrophilus TaxID=1434752 RepID=UPI00084DB990|nr:PepSY domain-containing protein [Arcticibacter eurypsychrophilus]
MTISIWRYSHLALALSSFILLILAAVTGVILAFQPVAEKMQPYQAEQFNSVTLAQSLPALRKAYPGISEITIDANHFVKASGSYANGKKLLAYVDPLTGRVLGIPDKKSDFFEWVTAFHRSLFLHGMGRFFVGLTAFLLLLITVSGTILIIQRQRGVKRFFTRIAKDNFAQYYHVVLGRLSLIPIIIIALSGIYLSFARFGLVSSPNKLPEIDFDAIRSEPKKKAEEFAIFKQTKLSDVESVEFPFSEDVEDYYTLKLKTGEVAVNQITGDIISDVKYPTAVLITNLSLDLHTGRANSIWAIILALASANILFFIYSGFAITLKRRANRTRNKYNVHESKFIILVGSENGNTFSFARSVHRQLIKAGEKSFLTELNRYTVFSKAEYLLVFTATYGLGDAPTNAAKFANLLAKFPQQQSLKYSVLGFGSHAYPDFCKFAFEVSNLLSHQDWAVPLIDMHTVNDRSPAEFGLWTEAWSQQAGISIEALTELHPVKAKNLEELSVTAIAHAEHESGLFTISLKAKGNLRVASGDLLVIYPENDHRERLYSIGVIGKEIRLSVRLHLGGLGSGFLNRLKPGDKIQAKIVSNTHFHFPEKASEVVMISNGTGIAPFLGMISANTGKISCHLYCGFRDKVSFERYQRFLDSNKAAGQVLSINVAISREGQREYVYNLIEKDADRIAAILGKGGVMMICGSLSMQKDVMELLETICQTRTNKSLSFYQSHDQIRTDCY